MMLIESIDQLYGRYALPTSRVVSKEIAYIDAHLEKFIALSPFLVIASGDEHHQMDASPRGGAPGFVRVIGSQTLLIPDAPGNNRLDTLQNILKTRRIGLLFLIPGVDEMVRISGEAVVSVAPELIGHFSSDTRAPKSVIQVTVRSAYMHCAKAVMRSHLWVKETQIERGVLPTMGQIVKDHAQLDGPAESQEDMLKRYVTDL